MEVNQKIIQEQMFLKNLDAPYTVSNNIIKDVKTEYNTFPYRKWYKGKYSSHKPIVDKREAGFRPVEFQTNKMYFVHSYRNLNFQPPCSSEPKDSVIISP